MTDREPLDPRPEEDEEEHRLYDLEDEESQPAAKRRFDADFLLDKVIPGEVDWRDLVRRHPFISVGLAAGLGFLIGRAKGAGIVAGASAAVTNAVMRQLSDVLEGEVFEF